MGCIENKKLIKDYPWLLPRNRWTDKVVEDYDYSYTELDDLPKGWKDLAINLCKEIKPILEKINYVNDFRIAQWKEKYGSLQLYYNAIPTTIIDELEDIISKYEKLSKEKCVVCGEKGEIDYNAYWLEPLCQKHRKEINNG